MVVFDCNVYLDVAALLGEPYSLAAFNQRAAQEGSTPPPHANSKVDSLRALAVCTSGIFAGSETVEVWTSDHIDRMVHNKATHPVTRDPVTRFKGLGWQDANAAALVNNLVYGVVNASGGGSIGQTFADGNPPLDHEDGLVYGACRTVAQNDLLCRTYCVTNDVPFLTDFREGRLPGHTVVLAPAQFLLVVRAARVEVARAAMMRPRGNVG